MDELSSLGYRVLLITSAGLKDKNWPKHALDEIFYMEEITPSHWNLTHLIEGFAYLLRNRKVDAVVALDDYDVEKAALIRETFRIPGMGTSTHHYFRDKLAMRQKASSIGLEVPEFSSVFNNKEVEDYLEKVEGPWVLKPRSQASASGIKKIHSKEQAFEELEKLDKERHLYLLESYRKGTVYHVDSLTYQGEVVFTCVSQYLNPPLDVSQGGVFQSITLGRYSDAFKALEKENKKVIERFGLQNGAAHTEFIYGEEDLKWYFLETSSRVGGAHIADLVETSTGVNLWREWAKIEHSVLSKLPYPIKNPTGFSAGLIIALSKEKHPDTSEIQCEEIVKTLPLDYHVGLVIKTPEKEQTLSLLEQIAEWITKNHLSVVPPKTM